MAESIRKVYEELGRKCKLPKFEELGEFQVSDLEDTKFLLSGIRGRIAERIQDSADFLSDILYPDSNLQGMYESRVFDEKEKKRVFDVFKRIMFWQRSSFEALVKGDDSANAEFISGFVSEWKGLKHDLVEVAARVKASWEAESEQPEKLGYFG